MSEYRSMDDLPPIPAWRRKAFHIALCALLGLSACHREATHLPHRTTGLDPQGHLPIDCGGHIPYYIYDNDGSRFFQECLPITTKDKL